MSLYLLFLFLLVLAAGVSTVLALYALRHRTRPGALPFVLMLLGEFIWTVSYLFELLVPARNTRIIWDNLQFHAADMLAVGTLLFALAYTGQSIWKRWYAGLLLVPLFNLLLIWTDPYHHLLRTDAWIDTSGSFPILAYTYGPWFWVVLSHSYLLILTGFVLVLAHSVRTSRFYHLQAGAVVLGLALPLVGSMLTTAGLVPIPGMPHLDIAPLTFAAANLLLAWGLFRRRLFDLVPIARNHLVESLPHGVIVVDAQQRIVDINPAACALLGATVAHPIGLPVTTLLPDLPDHFPPDSTGVIQFELLLPTGAGAGDGRSWVDVTMTRLEYHKERSTGWLINLRDVTGWRQTEEAYRTMVMHSLQALVILQDGHNVFVNSAAARISGYTQAELLAMSPEATRSVIHPDDQALLATRLDEQLAGQAVPSRYEFRLSRKDGAVRWIECFNTLITYRGRPAVQMSYIDVTDRKLAESRLREQEELFRLTFDQAPIGGAMVGLDYRFLRVNAALCQITGYSAAELQGRDFISISYPDDLTADLAQLEQLTVGHISQYTIDKRFIHKDGALIWGHLLVRLVCDEAGKPCYYLSMMEDITERKRAEAGIQEANTLLIRGINRLKQYNQEVLLLNQLVDLLQGCMTTADAYETVASIAAQLFVDQPGTLYRSNGAETLFEAVARWGDPPPPEPRFMAEECCALRHGHTFLMSTSRSLLRCRHVLATDLVSSLCVPLVARGQTIGVLHLRNGPVQMHEDRQHWQHLAEMVAGHVALALNNLDLRAQLQEQVIRDPLTGLFNRRYLDETLARELQRAARQNYPVGVIMLDIDHFKHFNDTHGHHAGDVLLRAVATYLQSMARGGDIACRYGGEEFTLVLPGASLEVTWQRAEEVRVGVNALVVPYDEQVFTAITLSSGVAAAPAHGTTGDALLKAADMALYQAKAAGRNRVIRAPLPAQDGVYPADRSRSVSSSAGQDASPDAEA